MREIKSYYEYTWQEAFHQNGHERAVWHKYLKHPTANDKSKEARELNGDYFFQWEYHRLTWLERPNLQVLIISRDIQNKHACLCPLWSFHLLHASSSKKHSRNSCFTTRYIAWTPALIKILSKCCLNFGQERRIRIIQKEQKAQKYKMCCFKNRNPHVAPWTARNPKTLLLMPAFFFFLKTGLILNQTLKRSWHAIT